MKVMSQMCIRDRFSSFNRHEEKKNRLVLSVFARELEVLDSDYDEDAANQIFLDGYICKAVSYTHLIRRGITITIPSLLL